MTAAAAATRVRAAGSSWPPVSSASSCALPYASCDLCLTRLSLAAAGTSSYGTGFSTCSKTYVDNWFTNT